MNVGPTHRQLQLLSFITARIEASGVAPSYIEMMEALGLASKSGVHRLLACLERRGLIVRLSNSARAIGLPERRIVLSSDLSAELRQVYGAGPKAVEEAIRFFALPHSPRVAA